MSGLRGLHSVILLRGCRGAGASYTAPTIVPGMYFNLLLFWYPGLCTILRNFEPPSTSKSVLKMTALLGNVRLYDSWPAVHSITQTFLSKAIFEDREIVLSWKMRIPVYALSSNVHLSSYLETAYCQGSNACVALITSNAKTTERCILVWPIYVELFDILSSNYLIERLTACKAVLQPLMTFLYHHRLPAASVRSLQSTG